MSEPPPPPEPTPRPPAATPAAASGPAGVRRNRPKPAVRVHPPVRRNLRDYWVMFCERWYWGLVPALIMGGVLAFLQLRKPELYRSTAKLQLTSRQASDRAGAGSTHDPAAVHLATLVEQMRSASFRDRVVTTFTPEEIQLIRRGYVRPGEDAAAAIDVRVIVGSAITITPSANAPIILIEAMHRDREGATVITGRYARSFIEFTADVADTDLNSSLQRVNEQKRNQRQRVEEAEARLQEFRQAHPQASATQDTQSLTARGLAAINDQLIEARSQRMQIEATLHVVDEARRQQQELTRIPYVGSYRSVGTLLTEIDQLQARRALLERKYLENHPSMKANQLEIDAKTELLRKNVEDAVAELRTKFAEAKQREERLAEDQKSAALEQSTRDEAGPVLRDLEQRVTTAKELETQVDRQRNEMLLARGVDDVAVSILDRATDGEPVAYDLRPTLIQGGVVALLLLFIVPVVFGLSDSRLKAAWEVEQFLKENLLGEMPSIDGVARKERPHIMARDLDHGAAEAFRGLFGQLQLNSTVPYPKLMMLTSTIPGEGKSVVANNLAATFAGHGKRTLLMDCDFRRPNLHVFYGKDNACGAMRWLDNHEDLEGKAEENEDLGILTLQENFYLLRAGGESRRATELFEMAAFARLLAALRKQFDVVILDTPPIGVFPDSMLLSRLVDEIVYVCRFNAVNRSKIRKCIERLRSPNTVFAGIVLNGIPSGKQSANYDYYGYGANDAKRYKAYYSQRR